MLPYDVFLTSLGDPGLCNGLAPVGDKPWLNQGFTRGLTSYADTVWVGESVPCYLDFGNVLVPFGNKPLPGSVYLRFRLLQLWLFLDLGKVLDIVNTINS